MRKNAPNGEVEIRVRFYVNTNYLHNNDIWISRVLILVG